MSHRTRYLRFGALGDSCTFGIGDPVLGGWRGWARLLADAMVDSGYDVSFCNLAVPGATSGTMLREQLHEGVLHSPDLAALVVGINDVMKSTWDPVRVHEEVFTCADVLAASGASLLTVRFHDHGQVLPLPQRIQRPLRNRIQDLNDIWDQVHAEYGGVQVDLGAYPDLLEKQYWAADRMHPSQLGHRRLAGAFADGLAQLDLQVTPPSLDLAGGVPPSWRRDVRWLLVEGAPWIGRRARDLAPWAARVAWNEVRPVLAPANGRQIPPNGRLIAVRVAQVATPDVSPGSRWSRPDRSARS